MQIKCDHLSYVLTDTLECASDPCQNGATCFEGTLQYVCNCAPGYTGVNCAESKMQIKFEGGQICQGAVCQICNKQYVT